MARLITQNTSGDPIDTVVGRVVEVLIGGLSDHYTIYPRVEIATGQDHAFKCDVIVIAPHAVYVLQVVDSPGDIVAMYWGWKEDGRSVASPVGAAEGKARASKRWLVTYAASLEAVWVAGVVVLAREPASLKLGLDLQQWVLNLNDLVDYVTDPVQVAQRPFAIRTYESLILNALRAIGSCQA